MMEIGLKRILTAAVIWLSVTGYAGEVASATQPIWGELFSPAMQKTWKLSKGVSWIKNGGSRILRIRLESNEARAAGATACVDIRSVRGCQLYGEIQFRAVDVTKPPKPYDGIKFSLSFKSGGETKYYHPSNLWGSTDWKTINFTCIVPDNATRGILYIGLVNSTGMVEFRDLEIHAFKGGEAGQKAQYDSTVLSRLRGRGVMSPGSSGVLPTVYRPKDLEDLAGWGANLIRWQLLTGSMKTKPGEPGYFQELDEKMNALFADLDKVLAQAQKLGIKVVIDLHTPIGGRLSKSEKVGYHRDKAIFYHKKYADYFVNLWAHIAHRYCGNPAVWAYNLMNEPYQNKPAPYDYYMLQLRAAEAIREIDPDTPICVEPTQMSNPVAFSFFPVFPLKNIIYQVHMYEPMEYTHQFVQKAFSREIPYPGKTVRYGETDRETLRKILQPVRDFQLEHNAKIYVGEFSAVRWAPGADRYLDDLISIFEEYGWDWTYHAFREWSGWSVEYSDNRDDTVPAAEETARKKVLLKYLRQNGR